MATTTSRLKLIKPADGESVDIDDINANSDTIDKHPGTFICTSTSRPANPFNGQQIHETDTQNGFVWDGTNWQQIYWGPEFNVGRGSQAGSSWSGQYYLTRTGPKTGMFTATIKRTSSNFTLNYDATGNVSSTGLAPSTNLPTWAQFEGMSYDSSSPFLEAVVAGGGSTGAVQVSISGSSIGIRLRSNSGSSLVISSAMLIFIPALAVTIKGN